MRIRISIYGIMYTAIGLLLLVSGLLRGELLSAACGGLLIVYAGFAVVALGITAFFWRSEEPDVEIRGESFTVRLKAALSRRPFPICVPGTAVSYIFEFSAAPHPDAETVLTVSVSLQDMQTVYRAENVPRGRYFDKRQYLCIRDFAGFFSILFMQRPQEHRLYTVLQPIIPIEDRHFPNLRSGAVDNVPSQERTAELYESRPYFPGDDPRKIHWKLYAHTRTLAIKLGAFKPPPVKQLTIYIEEPLLIKKKNRALLASVFDAFIGRLSFLILRMQETGIQCSILLNDYCAEERAAPLRGMPRKSLQRYDVQTEETSALIRIRNLLSIPLLCSEPKNIPDVQAVFHAVPEKGGLLYCYVPPVGIRSPVGIFDAEAKIAASRYAGVQTFFYLAVPPFQSDQVTMPFYGTQHITRLLYTSTASVRKENFYRKLQHAAEREQRIFTERNCHAELL